MRPTDKKIFGITVIPLFTLGLVWSALPVALAREAAPAAQLCIKLAETRIMTSADRSACQQKISNSSFDPDAVGVCSAMLDLRYSTKVDIMSCIEVIRDKIYPNGTDVCLAMYNSLATKGDIIACLANSGKINSVNAPIPAPPAAFSVSFR